MHPGHVWLVFALILLILEIVTPGTFFMASLAVGALVAALAAFLLPVWWMQWVVFCIVTTLCVFIARHLVQKLDKTPTVPFNVDALIGKRAVVIEPIDAAGKSGRVRVENQEWRACAERDIQVGEQVEVREVRGNRLFVA